MGNNTQNAARKSVILDRSPSDIVDEVDVGMVTMIEEVRDQEERGSESSIIRL